MSAPKDVVWLDVDDDNTPHQWVGAHAQHAGGTPMTTPTTTDRQDPT